jgi:hypothetical protein
VRCSPHDVRHHVCGRATQLCLPPHQTEVNSSLATHRPCRPRRVPLETRLPQRPAITLRGNVLQLGSHTTHRAYVSFGLPDTRRAFHFPCMSRL